MAALRRDLVLVALVAVLLADAAPVRAATVDRLAGSDRYASAAAVSRSRFAPGVPVAFVVSGRAFADALTAGPAAAHRGGPVLLTDTGSLPRATADELDRLQPGEIVVVGGTGVVGDAVVRELEQHTEGAVRRVSGPDRYATAARLSADTFSSATTVYVANGTRFSDALAGAPAARGERAPMLLTPTTSLAAATGDEIRRLGARRAVILGGAAVVDANVEQQLRALVGDVTRVAGADRFDTAVAASKRAFAGGATVAYVASGASPADALAGGPVAALAPGPILLARANCLPPAVSNELFRLGVQRVVVLGGVAVLGEGVARLTTCPYGGAPPRTPTVTSRPTTPAWDDAAPDPSLLRVGATWYVFSTGTTWGNRIGVLTSDRPDGGWRTITGKPYGSTALPSIPSWQVPDTQWAPGVYPWRGRYVMFYAARVRAHGYWCISSAVADAPTGPYVDRSGGPMVCQTDIGGSIDPHPFIDADGRPWLHWKNNDGSTPDVSKVWSAPLGEDGRTIVGTVREVMAKNSERYVWQTTLDNPQMVIMGGLHYLFYTAGDWQNETYMAGYAICAGPQGPCDSGANPIITSYGDVAGPGGGSVEQGPDGRWWLSYHAWHSSCTNDACGGVRRLYVAPFELR